MTFIRLIKFVLFWFAAWVLMGTISVGTTYYLLGTSYYEWRLEQPILYPHHQFSIPYGWYGWLALAIGLGSGVPAFGAARWFYLKHGGTRGAEVGDDGFTVYDGGDNTRVTWPEVLRITAGPELDTHMVSLRIQVEGLSKILKVDETSEGFAELKEKLHMVYGAPEAWLSSATQSLIVLYQRKQLGSLHAVKN